MHIDVVLDAEGRLVYDLPCTLCGYNLRGLPPAGTCPECAAAVSQSLRGDRLAYCDRRWLATIRSGLSWLINWLQCLILVGVLTVFDWGVIRGVAVAPLFALAGGVLGMVGFWLFTSPDPGKQRDARIVRSANLVRYAMVAACWLMAAESFLLGSNPRAAELVRVIQQTLVLVALCGAFVYMTDLARRIPDRWLARFARVVIVIAGAIVLVFWLIALTATSGLGRGSVLLDLLIELADVSRPFVSLFVALGLQRLFAELRWRLREVLENSSDLPSQVSEPF